MALPRRWTRPPRPRPQSTRPARSRPRPRHECPKPARGARGGVMLLQPQVVRRKTKMCGVLCTLVANARVSRDVGREGHTCAPFWCRLWGCGAGGGGDAVRARDSKRFQRCQGPQGSCRPKPVTSLYQNLGQAAKRLRLGSLLTKRKRQQQRGYRDTERKARPTIDLSLRPERLFRVARLGMPFSLLVNFPLLRCEPLVWPST